MPGLTRDGEKSYRGFWLVDSEEFILQSQNERILLQSDFIYCSHLKYVCDPHIWELFFLAFQMLHIQFNTH